LEDLCSTLEDVSVTCVSVGVSVGVGTCVAVGVGGGVGVGVGVGGAFSDDDELPCLGAASPSFSAEATMAFLTALSNLPFARGVSSSDRGVKGSNRLTIGSIRVPHHNTSERRIFGLSISSVIC
jgi:hypothetical protein